MKPQKLEYLKIKKSKIHSTGGFASKDITKGTRIIEYIGNKISKKESEKICDIELAKNKKNKKNGAVYIFELNKKFDIDGNVKWNPARFINHSCSPNAEIEIMKGKIWIISKNKIKKGEEITYDYGYDAEEWYEHPCKCNSNKCLGYIVGKDNLNKFRRIS